MGFELETVPKKKLQHEFRGLGFSTSMKSWVCEFRGLGFSTSMKSWAWNLGYVNLGVWVFLQAWNLGYVNFGFQVFRFFCKHENLGVNSDKQFGERGVSINWWSASMNSWVWIILHSSEQEEASARISNSANLSLSLFYY